MVELIIEEWKFEMKNEINFSIASLSFSLVPTFDNNDKSCVLFFGSADPRMLCLKCPW